VTYDIITVRVIVVVVVVVLMTQAPGRRIKEQKHQFRFLGTGVFVGTGLSRLRHSGNKNRSMAADQSCRVLSLSVVAADHPFLDFEDCKVLINFYGLEARIVASLVVLK
jgi:hypothetical protein